MQRSIKEISEIRAKITELEILGCVVMPPEELEQDFQQFELARQQYKQMREKRNRSYFKPIDFMSMSQDALNDSVVPACCIMGCMVEPDGICEHGHPSVIKYNLQI